MRNRPIPFISDADKDYVRSLLIYEDAGVLAFNKPSGLAVQSRGNRDRCLDTLLWAFARSNGKRPRLVHRLDAGTSGLIVAAKTQPVAATLSAAFAERTIAKTYIAIVGGRLPEASTGQIDLPLLKLEGHNRPAQSIASSLETRGAKSAVTDWKILARAEAFALVQARPHTGRMHQIRVHLASLGCPILGDTLYGDGALSAPRLMLHAAELVIPDFTESGTPLSLTAPLPPDFLSTLQRLGLSRSPQGS